MVLSHWLPVPLNVAYNSIYPECIKNTIHTCSSLRFDEWFNWMVIISGVVGSCFKVVVYDVKPQDRWFRSTDLWTQLVCSWSSSSIVAQRGKQEALLYWSRVEIKGLWSELGASKLISTRLCVVMCVWIPSGYAPLHGTGTRGGRRDPRVRRRLPQGKNTDNVQERFSGNWIWLICSRRITRGLR